MAQYSSRSALQILKQLDIYSEYQGVKSLGGLLADTPSSVVVARGDAVSLLYSGVVRLAKYIPVSPRDVDFPGRSQRRQVGADLPRENSTQYS